MTTQELNAKTVIELRKLAKEYGVKLGAGVSKSDIVAKIAAAMPEPEAPAVPAVEAAEETAVEAPVEAAPVQPAAPEEPAPEADAPKAEPAAAPQFKAAWHSPAPRYSNRPAYQAPSYPSKPSWQNNQARPAEASRPASYPHRFGPSAPQEAPAEPREREDFRPYRSDARTGGYSSGMQDRRPSYVSRNDYGQSRNYDAPPSYGNGYSRSYHPRPSYQPREQSTYQPREQSTYQPREQLPYQEPLADASLNDLLTAGECGDGSGILELHPDGYGFLRSDHFLPSARDIYVSMAQIRRFGLRTGDRIVGKTRPRRDGDKYTAMLYITEINGQCAEDAQMRPFFDELTPIYPTRRIDLESHGSKPLDDMRLIDLISPLGFGQRGLILCPPDTDKTSLLEHFASVISTNHPEAEVFVLLIDENPEDVTLFREQVDCSVIASTFDQAPETHLRLTDMVLERSQRLVEQGKDVVLIVDSLTQLAKVYTSNAALQTRAVPGMVNPSSLFRAKKLFGAARCLKEGGSLTIIGAMSIGTKVDDSVVEEFKGTANMELVLDSALAHAGVNPPVNLQLSGTKRAEALLTEAQQEGLQLVRSVIGTTRSSVAIPQIISLMNKTDSNDAFLAKFKDWVALMNKGN